MPDSITSLSDAALLTAANNAFAVAAANPGDYHTTLIIITSYQDAATQFDTDLTAHISAQGTARAARATKDASRIVLENALRTLRNIAKAGGTPDATLTALNLPHGSTPAPSNATVPAMQVNTAKRLQHTLSWTDAATPENKKKPRGAMGAEIWVKFDGPPPVDESECRFLTLDSATPYVSEYSGADGGKTAHYLVRWRMSDGSVTAWGETVSATITA